MATAIILAGGLGTRLAGVIPHLPKALAPIRGVPFLQLILKQLEESQVVSQVIFALGHKASDIQSFLSDYPSCIPIELSIEATPLGTGGALLQALRKSTSETLLVLNGDSYFDLSLADFLHAHRSRWADVSIACHFVEETSRYGSVEFDDSHRILKFSEKSSEKRPGWINAGMYCLQKRILDSFSPGVYSLERDFFSHFLKRNCFAYCHRGAFIDIGIPSSYEEAQEFLKPWITQ